MISVTQRIPTEQYAYIEFTTDYESVGDAIAQHTELCARYNDEGLPDREWAGVRNKMFETGQFDPNIEGLSKAQKYFVNQCKLALRSLEKNNEPTIN